MATKRNQPKTVNQPKSSNTVAVRRTSKLKAFDATLSPAQMAIKRRVSNAGKVDWNKAFAWFMEDATRSYADVAREFDVTKRSVERKAYVDNDDGSFETWAERRQRVGDEVRKKAEDDYRKSIPAREEQHLALYRNLQLATGVKINLLVNQGDWLVDPKTGKKVKVQEFSTRELADAAKALKLSIDGERVILGLSTSVSTIKPGENEKGQGWGELLLMAQKRVAEAESDEPNDESQS